MRRSRLAAAGLLALLALAFGARSLALSSEHPFPADDEVSNLDMARDFAARGAGGTLLCYLKADCLKDTFHPLYPFLLSLAVKDAPKDFSSGKLLSLACSILLLAAVFWFTRQVWGADVSLMAAAGLAFSTAATILSQQLRVDGLFTVFYFSALWSLGLWSDRPFVWPLFGLLAGLAYLTKGDGHFLLLAAPAVGLNREGARFFRRPALYLALAGFTFAAFPLLWRNVMRWGNPFHHFIAKAVWLDNDEFWAISDSQYQRIGWRWYFDHHSPAQAIARFSHGLVGMASQLSLAISFGNWELLERPLAYAVSFDAGKLEHPFIHEVVPLALFLSGWRKTWREGHKDLALAIAAPSFVLFLAFAWGAQVGGPNLRYVFPLAVSCLPMAAAGLVEWMGAVSPSPPRIGPALGLAAAALLAANAASLVRSPLRLWELQPDRVRTSAWLRRNAPEGYLIDPRSDFTNWDRGRVFREECSFDAPKQELERFARGYEVRAAIVDMAAPHTGDAIGPPDRFGPTSFLGWPRCYHDSREPSRFLAYMARCP